MRVGINLLNLSRERGGQFQFALTFAQSLMKAYTGVEYVIFCESHDFAASDFPDTAETTLCFVENVDRCLYSLRASLRLLHILGVRVDIPFMRGKYEALRRAELDLVVQPDRGAGAFLAGVPYIYHLPDLLHRDNNMPHTVGWWMQELRLRASARGALSVMVDSQHLKERVTRLWRIPSNCLEVLPYRPPRCLRSACFDGSLAQTRQEYGLPERYIFYPSNPSPVKNHEGLLRALRLLREGGLLVSLILVGSRARDFARVMAHADRSGLAGQVRYLGYVPDQDMPSLYRLATALVFPTFLGPTALPVVEAFALGCPVICSNIPDYPTQVGDAGLLVDPHQPSEIAEAIRKLWTDQKLRDVLIQRGLERSAMLDSRDYGEEIAGIIHRAWDRAGLGIRERR